MRLFQFRKKYTKQNRTFITWPWNRLFTEDLLAMEKNIFNDLDPVWELHLNSLTTDEQNHEKFMIWVKTVEIKLKFLNSATADKLKWWNDN